MKYFVDYEEVTLEELEKIRNGWDYVEAYYFQYLELEEIDFEKQEMYFCRRSMTW